MKKSIRLSVLVVLLGVIVAFTALGCGRLPGTDSAPDVSATNSKKAADFTVTDMDDNQVSLSDSFGKPIIVNFWATWCGPCRAELPAFDNAYKKYGDEIVFMMVNLTDGYRDVEGDVKDFVAENAYSFPVYFDTENSASAAYGISSIPLTVFIDKNGSVYDSHISSMSEETLEKYINALTSDSQ